MRNNNLKKNSEYNKYRQPNIKNEKKNVEGNFYSFKKSKIIYYVIFLIVLILIFCFIKFIFLHENTVDISKSYDFFFICYW